MERLPHYLFSVGLLNLYSMIFVNDPVLGWIAFFGSFIMSYVALIPDLIDQYAGASYKYEGVQLKRYRHPLTHSPLTIVYFIPFLYISNILNNQILILISVYTFLSWISHLLLDSFNPEGIPIGKKPIMSNHLSKHYKWSKFTKTRKLSFARVDYYDQKANLRIILIGLLFTSLNISNLLINFFFIISGLIK